MRCKSIESTKSKVKFSLILLNDKENMQQIDYKIAKELKERLSKIVSLVDFKVFGSRARGSADEYSDMDVFIETEYLTKELEEKIYHTAWEIGLEHLIFISPLVFTRYEVENSPLRVSPIVRNIEEEGIRV
jgi:predicted nucleotidyltransferase